ncbi:hypothetical protein ACFL2V_05730 [Pseudomonadota bacterium]
MENSQDKIVYYILREKADEPGDLFAIFVNDLKYYIEPSNIIQESPGLISISADSHNKGIVENNPSEVADKFAKFRFKAKLSINREDNVNLDLIRRLAVRAKSQYRVFSTLYKCFLPKNIDLISLEFGLRDEKLARVFSQFQLKPLFVNQNLGHFYALNQNGQVVIVNKYLIGFLYGKDIPEKNLKELSYIVADSIQTFGLKYDRRIIPTNFYDFFGKSSKIINESKFNINNPGRKVFIKPYIFELREEMGEFYQITGRDGQAMLMMDKIRRGETLDVALKRVLSEELKIASDYIGAFVSEEIEFDRDRDGIITPRLVIWVYIKKIEKERPKVIQMSQTGWQSIGGNAPHVNVSKEFKKQNQ